MPRPEETLEELARLAREDEALRDRLPSELSTPISAEKTAALVGAIQGKLTTRNRERLRNLLAAGGAFVAIAAGALLFVGRPGQALPEYEVRVAGGQQSERSSLDQRPESLRLRGGSTLTFELRPRTDFSGALEARAVLSSREFAKGEVQALELSQEQSASGALRVEVRVPASLPGSGTLMLFVARTSDPLGDDRKLFQWPFERSR